MRNELKIKKFFRKNPCVAVTSKILSLNTRIKIISTRRALKSLRKSGFIKTSKRRIMYKRGLTKKPEPFYHTCEVNEIDHWIYRQEEILLSY